MINLFQIDKSGNDVLEKDYSIVLVSNKKDVYGVNIPQSLKDKLVYLFKKGDLNINHKSERQKKNRFKIRFDIDDHFHEIKDMIFKHISKSLINLKPEDIVLTRFQKPSLVDNSGKSFRKNEKEILKEYNIVKLDEGELIKIIKK